MSKGSLFWANASGKLGETVLYRSGGEQRSRTYVKNIKNPKTLAQMKNRLSMNNVVSAFHAMKPLLQATFPVRKSNQSAFNVFVKSNKNVKPFYIMKNDLENNLYVPFGMQVAKGNLGISVKPQVEDLINEQDPEAAPFYYHVVEGLLNLKNFEITDSDLELDAGLLELTPALAYKVFSECSVVSLPSEFQISLIATKPIAWHQEEVLSGWTSSYGIYHCQANNAYSQVFGSQETMNDLKIALHVSEIQGERGESNYKVKFDKLIIGRRGEDAEYCALNSCAIILSYRDAAGVQVTNSYMSDYPRSVGARPLPNRLRPFEWNGSYAKAALDEYGYSADSVLVSTADNTPTSEPENEEEEEGGEDLTS